ncbi:hypothetical protein DB32_006813 [Sandaracinus amylolyticus]|uniref:Uncharacterized protein n=1 Tax=Sandaracinus amylolyticus TaxID=927083 RepID=A0A0F6SH17_9BACT|nr:hypothetical protein DB32_006813 [Sandaracinus amylolyticus]
MRVEGDDRFAAAVRARIARVPFAIVTDRGAELDVLRGSRVRPTLTLDRPVDDDDAAREATRLGASALAWEGGDGWSPWERCLAPLIAHPLRGSPDPTRRWALIEDPADGAIPHEEDRAWQWHAVVPRRRPALPAHVVQWPLQSRVVAPLLGAATAVIGESGPLVYDAWRLRRPVLASAPGSPIDRWATVAAPMRDARLAHSIPPLLADSAGFWERVIATVRDRGAVLPAMSASAMRAAREHALAEDRTRWGALRRELRKLREDPGASLRTARLWAIRTLWSSARPPSSRVGPIRRS